MKNEQTNKKKYEAPVLTEHGSVEELTQDGGHHHHHYEYHSGSSW